MKLIWAIALSGLLIGQASGQEVRVVPGEVVDRRTMISDYTGSGGCEIELRLIGDGAADTMSIRAARIRTATDDTGRDLLPAKEPSRPYVRSRGESVIAKLIQLKNPVRSAKAIKLLEGELDLFQPTTGNGGKITIKDFQAHPGLFIESPELKKSNIQLIYATKETEESAQQRLEEEAKRSGAATASWADPLMARSIPYRRSMEGLGETRNMVRLLFNDPDKRLVEVGLLDASGMPITTRSHFQSPMCRYFFSEADLPKDAQLLLYVATVESIKTVSFRLDNIPLP